MEYQKKVIALLIMISLFIVFGFGCNSNLIVPVVPGIDPNPNTNPNNSTVNYIKVISSSSIIKVNQSQQFVVRGYNSNDEWVILDKSKIKLWDWSIQGQCYDCVKESVDLSPKSGSLTTIFTSGITGTFFIVAYYQENKNISDNYITNYVQIIVTD